jgi:hypothetical protein
MTLITLIIATLTVVRHVELLAHVELPAHMVLQGYPFVSSPQCSASMSLSRINRVTDCLAASDFDVSPDEDEYQAQAALHGTPTLKGKGRGAPFHKVHSHPRHL